MVWKEYRFCTKEVLQRLQMTYKIANKNPYFVVFHLSAENLRCRKSISPRLNVKS